LVKPEFGKPEFTKESIKINQKQSENNQTSIKNQSKINHKTIKINQDQKTRRQGDKETNPVPRKPMNKCNNRPYTNPVPKNNLGMQPKDLTQIQYPKTLHKSSTQQTYDKCKKDITQIQYPENQ
jgi:hypothetical protein